MAKVITFLIINFIVSFMADIPITKEHLVKYCVLGYILGYIIDMLIEKLSIFGKSLDKFYEIVGSGHSGAAAFVVSIIMSYFLQNNLLPLLK